MENGFGMKRIKYITQGRNGYYGIDLQVEGETGAIRNVLIIERVSRKTAESIADELNAAYIIGIEQGRRLGMEGK